MQRPWRRRVADWLAPHACSACSLIYPRTSYPETAPPTVGWNVSHNHQLRQCRTDVHTGQSDLEKVSLEVSYSQVTYSCVCVMLTAGAKHDKPSPNDVTFCMEHDLVKNTATERCCIRSLEIGCRQLHRPDLGTVYRMSCSSLSFTEACS